MRLTINLVELRSNASAMRGNRFDRTPMQLRRLTDQDNKP
jgi:hypothetical protein